MKKLIFVLFVILAFSVTAFACPQHLIAKPYKSAHIYVVYSNLQNVSKNNALGYDYYPITCTFKTNYNGKVPFFLQNFLNDTLKMHVISRNQSYKHTFTKPLDGDGIRNSSISVTSNGCNSGFDGERCILAKIHHLDNVIVDCS